MEQYTIVKEEQHQQHQQTNLTEEEENEDEDEDCIKSEYESSSSDEEPNPKRPKVEDVGQLPQVGVDSVHNNDWMTVKEEHVKAEDEGIKEEDIKEEQGGVKDEEGVKEEDGVKEDDGDQDIDGTNRIQVGVNIQVKDDNNANDECNNVNHEHLISEENGPRHHESEGRQEEGDTTRHDESNDALGQVDDVQHHDKDNGQETCFDVSANDEHDEHGDEDDNDDKDDDDGMDNVEKGLQSKSHKYKIKYGREKASKSDTTSIPPDDLDDDSVTDSLRKKVDAEGMYAFCCCNCKCKEKKGGKKGAKKGSRGDLRCRAVKNNCANSSGDTGMGNTKLYHRGCCHNFRKLHADYLSPVQISIDTALEAIGIEEDDEEGDGGKSMTIKDILQHYKNGLRNVDDLEKVEWNEEDGNDNHSIHDNPVYIQYCNDFQQRIKGCEKQASGALRVLDLFSGIGSGTVVLKKLKIPLCTVVNVEHDPVAKEVAKFHHLNDGIRHIYMDKFEEIYGDGSEPDEDIVTRIIDGYGPFDLVLAGTPCPSYAQGKVCKSSKGKKSDKYQKYQLKVGLLIQMMNALQFDVEHDILFLSESIIFDEDVKLDVKSVDAINKSYGEIDGCGLEPIFLDAKDFSPCKRSRLYWSNIPMKSADAIKKFAAHESVEVCLDEGFLTPESVLESEGLLQQHDPVKANTFMSSLSTINDDRMMKIKKESTGKYFMHSFSVRERERMLGFPLEYVQDAIHHLFHSLTFDAFLKPETKEGTSHRDFLDQSLWHFRKKCNFQFKPKFGEAPFFQIEIAAPAREEEPQNVEYFDEEGYCKYLLGNAWSLPVVEHLLKPLQDLFDKDDLQTYEKYDYSYPWEPYASNGKTEVSVPQIDL